ncbi:28495_t:CDS:2, partial [Gigaspora margarita]
MNSPPTTNSAPKTDYPPTTNSPPTINSLPITNSRPMAHHIEAFQVMEKKKSIQKCEHNLCKYLKKIKTLVNVLRTRKKTTKYGSTPMFKVPQEEALVNQTHIKHKEATRNDDYSNV